MNERGTIKSEAEQRIESVLKEWAGIVGNGPYYSQMMPSVLIPMRQAIDSLPYAVTDTGKDRAELMVKLMVRDGLSANPFPVVIEATEQAARLGIAPELIAWEASQEAMLFPMLQPEDWRGAKVTDFDSDELLHFTLLAKKKFHNSKPLSISSTPFEKIRELRAILAQLQETRKAQKEPWYTPEGFFMISDYIANIERAFIASGMDSVPVHGEPALSNIFIGKNNAIKLVDFDRAYNADPHYDLAGLSLEICGFDWQVDRVVENYYGEKREDVKARVQLLMIVDDFLWGCWSLANHYLSERKNAIEFFKSAQNRFLRCQYWLSRWDISTLLHRL